VIGRCTQRHRHQEFIRFLNAIEAAVPTGKVVHVILDNYAVHKHAKVRAWSGEATAIDSTSVMAQRSAHGGKGGGKAQAIGPLILCLSKDVRRPDDQDPRPHRCPRPARRRSADAGQRRRRLHRPSRSGRGTRSDPPPGRRRGLRRRLAARRPAREGASRRSSRASAVGRTGSATTSGATGNAGVSSFDSLRMRATFNRLKDFRRIATRFDKLARNYASAAALAAVIGFWC